MSLRRFGSKFLPAASKASFIITSLPISIPVTSRIFCLNAFHDLIAVSTSVVKSASCSLTLNKSFITLIASLTAGLMFFISLYSGASTSFPNSVIATASEITSSSAFLTILPIALTALVFPSNILFILSLTFSCCLTLSATAGYIVEIFLIIDLVASKISFEGVVPTPKRPDKERLIFIFSISATYLLSALNILSGILRSA